MKKKEKPEKPEKIKKPKKERKPKEPKKNKNPENAEKPKKRFKIFILIPIVLLLLAAIAFAVLFLLGNNGIKKAEASVGGLFASFQSLDFEKAEEYIDLNALDLSDRYTSLGDTEMFMNSLFDQLSYEIVSSEEMDQDTVIVKTSITAIKMKPVMADFIVQAVDAIYENIKSSEPLSDEEMEKKKDEIFEICASWPDLKTVTHEVDIKVTRADGTWRIGADAPLVNALFGGLIDVAGDFFGDDPEEEVQPRQTEPKDDAGGH